MDGRFPREFLWGVATAAQQIEGATREGGRGESIWDRYASVPGNIEDGTDTSVCCDHYHRWREDFALMRWLGVNAYRFSIAWPRVFPTGAGAPNAAGFAFYDALVDALLEAGITPFVTLNHWDLPQALQERGGWSSRDTVAAFADYAEVATRRLGDRVRHWVTHNEPWCVSQLGWERGVHAPGMRSPADSLKVAHHLLLSHGRAVQAIRATAPGAAVGLVNLAVAVQPASGSDADREAARRSDGAFNRWFMDPLYRGAYPADVVADHARLGRLGPAGMDFVHEGDLACIATPTDFLGVNYYSRSVIRAGEDGEPEQLRMVPEAQLTDMGWEVYPDGLVELLTHVTRTYAPPAIFVTENGAAFADPADGSSPLADPRRVDYLRAHVDASARAIAAGVPLAGYFAWSLMDNFEWGHGLAKRFGLFHVDFQTQARTPRASARWYRDFLAGSDGNVEVVAQHHTRRIP